MHIMSVTKNYGTYCTTRYYTDWALKSPFCTFLDSSLAKDFLKYSRVIAMKLHHIFVLFLAAIFGPNLAKSQVSFGNSDDQQPNRPIFGQGGDNSAAVSFSGGDSPVSSSENNFADFLKSSSNEGDHQDDTSGTTIQDVLGLEKQNDGVLTRLNL
jgi:hypothetical protein